MDGGSRRRGRCEEGDDGERRQERVRRGSREHERRSQNACSSWRRRNRAWMSATVRKELAFLGEDNIANKSAVKNLIAMGKRRARSPVPALRRRDRARKAAARREGARAGPAGSHANRRRSASNDPRTRISSGTSSRRGARAAPPPADEAVPAKRGQPVPAEARWFRDRLLERERQGLLEIVRQLDEQMNNTSLILLVRGRREEAAVPGRRAARELELRADGGEGQEEGRRSCSPTSTSTKSDTTEVSTRRRASCCGRRSRSARVASCRR